MEMKMGMTFTIKGKIHNCIDSFYIKLGQGKDLLNLVFNPRFDESAIVLNSWDGTNWGQELRVDHMCFSPGSDVKFTMVFQGNQFQVTLPDGYVISFPNRTSALRLCKWSLRLLLSS
ncbi:galectin-2-like [Nannospalax galili]|uniref:galectin-2-like n=1 Tax=Nannospalax galili TaxID=1026970 RepID=UPI00111C370C|nr:galectin-2-like [Nannospalax galili]